MPQRDKPRAEDRRVRRTKKMLRDCLFSLLEEKTADEITVKELTELADINRSTFYFYYNDIDDMLFRIQEEIYAVFEEEVIKKADVFETAEDFIQYLTRFLVFCKDNEKHCKFVVSNDPGNKLSKRIKDGLMQCIPDTTLIFEETDPRRYLTEYAVAGFWQLILTWMYEGMKIEPREMAVLLTNVYFYGSRSVLKRQGAKQTV